MILIGTPCRDMVHAGFAYDLAALCGCTRDVRFSTVPNATVLANSRHVLAETALANDFSHILLIDSDMRFPPDALSRLLARDVDIVGANYLERVRPIWTANVKGESITSQGRTGKQEVSYLGMGCALIRCSVFAKLPKPWFSMPWDGDKHLTEDVFFCRHARQHGYTVNVDHDLSQQVRHVGTIELGVT